MKTSAYFTKGRSHNICEDYCIAKTTRSGAYVIGSDGCSSSSGTDFGSRIICHCARTSIEAAGFELMNSLTTRELEDYLKRGIVKGLHEAQTSFHLNRDSLDATLVILLAEKNRVRYFFWGDGALITRRASGLEIISLEYASGAPRYLSYDLAPDDQKAYLREFGGAPLFLERKFIFQEGSVLSEKSMLPEYHYCGEIPASDSDDLISVTAVSDGIHTFTDLEGRRIPTEQVAEELTEFKNSAGDFMIRRIKKIQRLNRRREISHYDDLFSGAIIFNHREATHENLY